MGKWVFQETDTTYPREFKMLLEILLLSILFAILYVAYLLRGKPTHKLSRRFEDRVAAVMAHVDDTEFKSGEENGSKFARNLDKPNRFQAKLIVAAKAKFGRLRWTEANRHMVRKYIGELMEQHGMRPSHILRYSELATTLTFVPSRHEIDAYKAGAAIESISRQGEVDVEWESYYGKVGRMLGFSSS
jgi:hypothetical protein